MADVWKSQGRKFCEICKVWFGDNRASIEFHERGKKHRDALSAKLRELGRASREKEKMEAKMSTALAAMEEAALKAMKENGEGLDHGPALPSTGLSSKIFDPRTMKDVGSFAREMAKRKAEMQDLKNQKRAAPPASSVITSKYFKKSIQSSVGYPELTIPTQEHKVEAISSSQVVWAEADAGDGRSYYFHLYTGESTWDRPESFYTAEEYARLIQSTESPSTKVEAVVVEEEGLSTKAPNSCDIPADKPQVEEATVPVVVKAELVEEEAANVPHDINDIPLPGCACVDKVPVVKDESSSDTIMEAEVSETVKETVAVPAQADKVKQEPDVYPTVDGSFEEDSGEGSLLATGPLGSWTRVQKVSSGPVFSPLTARYRAEEAREKKAAEIREKQAEKLDPLIFSEKASAVLTKKVKGPIEFKKRSAAKSVRQRTQ